MHLERQQYEEMVAKAFLLRQFKDPSKQKSWEAIRKRGACYSMSITKASSGIMHLAWEMYDNVMGIKTVEVPGEFFNKTFNRHFMHGTGKNVRRVMSECTPSTKNIPFTDSRVL
jgi:hypothetical protein